MAKAPLLGAQTHQRWTERVPGETAEGLRLRHPAVEAVAEQRAGSPGEVLTATAGGPEPMVLGPRGLGGAVGVLPGAARRCSALLGAALRCGTRPPAGRKPGCTAPRR
ncbi:hypothetical protein [Streptomyces sp. NPDC006309]|uniref:hypothetical protein n=1 Tax=Streptomyces sp. NPDC006309 TaxID=3156749 RepID=UPI0033BECE43